MGILQMIKCLFLGHDASTLVIEGPSGGHYHFIMGCRRCRKVYLNTCRALTHEEMRQEMQKLVDLHYESIAEENKKFLAESKGRSYEEICSDLDQCSESVNKINLI